MRRLSSICTLQCHATLARHSLRRSTHSSRRYASAASSSSSTSSPPSSPSSPSASSISSSTAESSASLNANFNKSFFITTPIFYVNGPPHLGHLSSALLADARARTERFLERSQTHVENSSASARSSNSPSSPLSSSSFPSSSSSSSAHSSTSASSNVFFATGTDEHGVKVRQAASKAGEEDTERFASVISQRYRLLFEKACISHSDFIRTTEKRHQRVVHEFWRRLMASGDVYRGKHEGWYCAADEAFVPEANVVFEPEESVDASTLSDAVVEMDSLSPSYPSSSHAADGAAVQSLSTNKEQPASASSSKRRAFSPEGHPLEWQSEENYMFRLSRYQQPLIEWLQRTRAIQPPERLNEVLSFLQTQPLNDLSITRARSRLAWGIAVPDDEMQTVYVWLDALINYLTVAVLPSSSSATSSNPSSSFVASTDAEASVEQNPLSSDRLLHSPWPADVHLVGKDILRFHAVYWPAFLMSAGLPLPRSIVAHAHWTVDRRKMSKSFGNVVNPFEMLEMYGVDATRYFILYSASLLDDSNYSQAELMKRYADLPDALGNLLARLTSKSLLPSNRFPEPPLAERLSITDSELVASICMLPHEVMPCFQSFAFGAGIDRVMSVLRKFNIMVQREEPWKLAKSDVEADRIRLQIVIYLGLEAVRIAALLLQPIIPDSCALILERLSVPVSQRRFEHTMFGRAAIALADTSSIVFPRIDLDSSPASQVIDPRFPKPIKVLLPNKKQVAGR